MSYQMMVLIYKNPEAPDMSQVFTKLKFNYLPFNI